MQVAVRSSGGRAPAAVGWVGVFPAQSGVDTPQSDGVTSQLGHPKGTTVNSTTTTRVTDEPATVHLSDDQAVTSIQFGTDDPITIALPLGIDMLPAAQVAWCLDLAEQLVANAARIKQVMGEVGQGWATTRREILA